MEPAPAATKQSVPAKRRLAEVLAASTAHGISRAVTATSIPLKIMWTLLFLVFLVLFFVSASSLIDKLVNVSVVKIHESDKVPFEFPDLYFCPSLIYSGSIPYTLNESEAKLVNDEVERLNNLYTKLFCGNQLCGDTFNRKYYIQMTMQVPIMQKYLMQQEQQSMLLSPYVYSPSSFSAAGYTKLSTFIHPNNQVCFKVGVDQEQSEFLTSKTYNLYAWLFTDPYYPAFNYSGARIKPIYSPMNEDYEPFEAWQDLNGHHSAYSLGYYLYIVPRGYYPSLLHETKVKLAAGMSYHVSIKMTDNVHAPELHGIYCQPNHENAVFEDYLTGGPVEFKYSQPACYYIEMAKRLKDEFKCLKTWHPRPWSLRDTPRLENMTEIELSGHGVQYVEFTHFRSFMDSQNQAVVDSCRLRRPCSFKEYRATTTSDKWPVVNARLAKFIIHEFSNVSDKNPATAQLVRLSEQFLAGNVSIREEWLFRHYIGESLIEIEVSVTDNLSPRRFITYSYSWVSFMADMGGTLGMYIGCSLMTLCEMLELVYQLLADWILVRFKTTRNSKEPETDGAKEAAPMELLPAGAADTAVCEDEEFA